jgi:anti-sigma regulatory factor (Ser/Thr protein kinase)
VTTPDQRTLPLLPRVEAPEEARTFLREALQTWALDGFGDVTELLTCELVSNVVRHAGTPMTLRVTRYPSAIRVEVDDESPHPPVLTNRGPMAEGGRGLVLIDGLATDWGSDARGDGKTVWFVLETETAEADKQPD